VAKAVAKNLGREMQPGTSRKRNTNATPSYENKRIKTGQRTLLGICGSAVVTEDAVQTEGKLGRMLKKELVDIALQLDVPVQGTKREIIDRLMDRYWQDRRDGCFSRGTSTSLDE